MKPHVKWADSLLIEDGHPTFLSGVNMYGLTYSINSEKINVRRWDRKISQGVESEIERAQRSYSHHLPEPTLKLGKEASIHQASHHASHL